MSVDLFFAVLDTDSQTDAVTAVWWIAVVITAAIVAGVALRFRKQRKQRAANARMIGRFRAAAFDTFPEAADEEFEQIARRLHREGR